jgi:hypothetical protein
MRRAMLLLVLAALLGVTAARAYVRDRSPKTGAALRWKGGALTLTLARRATSQDLSDSEVRQAVAAALAVWDRRNNPCSSVELRLAEGTTDNEVVEDGISSVSFREERWSRNGAASALARYSANMVALTSLYAKPCPGKPTIAEIGEADIELNAVDFRFTTDGKVTQNTASRTRDLQTVLVHEIGHILGLGHNCATSESERQSADNLGHRIPLCSVAGDSLRSAAMFPIESLATVPLVRDLSSDDRKALCALYPVRASPKRR